MSATKKTIKARIIAPHAVEHSVDAEMVVMPGSEGEFGVMYGHEAMIVELQSGNVKIYNGDKIDSFQIGSGIARIKADTVDILHGNQ